tara:strand:- start:9716 stop:11659 length:1944 start_codon:yes stop_codon:yes gene_type:complete
MARAVFGGGLSPYITKAQDRPTPYNPLGALSTAIRQPFVEDVIVPGISRIRDEMRIAEREEQIAAQAEAKRAAAAQFLQQAAAAEQQGLDAEVAAAVSGVDVPVRPLDTLPVEGPSRVLLTDAQKAMRDLSGLAAEARAAGRDPVQMVTQGGAWPRHMALLREAGMADVAIEILYGSGGDALRIPKRQLQQTQQRRGEQEAAAAATQRFERALAGELLQVAAEQDPLVIEGGKPRYATGAPGDDPSRLARRAYEKHLKVNPGDQEGAMAAAQQAFGASAPQPAAQPQAIASPESIERANRLRQQATALEAEAKGIEGTPVYRTFGDHAMAFLDALDSGDVATQMALMESVGGSTDYQPFGKGAVGKAIGKDASMRARKDLLDLKKKYLDAKRREDSAIKIAEKKAELRGKKTKTGGRGGGGTTRAKDRVLDSALQTLHRGEELSVNQQKALKKGGLLTEREVAALSPDRPDAWAVLRSRMSRRTPLRNDAATILKSRATFEEREVRKVAADEKAAQNAIKKLEAEVKLATGEEKKRKAQELERVKLDTKIGAATTRLDTAATDLIKAEYAVLASVTAQNQLREDIASDKAKNDPTFKTNKERELKQAEAKEKAQERIRVTLAAKEKRLDKELKALEAKRRAQPAKAN